MSAFRSPPQMRPDEPGPLMRRRECDADAEFRFRLFCDTRGALFAFLPPDQRVALLRQQLAAQLCGYAATYPDARCDIVEIADGPVGRMVVCHASDHVALIDIAILRQWQNRGIGTRLIVDLCVEAAARNVPLRLSVATDNVRARALYERRGFVASACMPTHVAMAWPR